MQRWTYRTALSGLALLCAVALSGCGGATTQPGSVPSNTTGTTVMPSNTTGTTVMPSDGGNTTGTSTVPDATDTGTDGLTGTPPMMETTPLTGTP